jgi:PIN domain nuclease of toxin-antitoxin system
VIVLDTHAWLWWQTTDDKLSGRARAEIESAQRIGVCTISCYELARAATRGRIQLDRDLDTWIAQALADARVDSLELTRAVATEAGALGDDFPGDPVDRIIYATTRQQGARLVTRDRILQRADPRLTVW